MKRTPDMKTVRELVFLAVAMLLGEEGKDFSYYEYDEEWWKMRLYMRIN